MKGRQFGMYAITLIIAGLMVTVSATAMIQQVSSEEKQTLTLTKMGKGIVDMDMALAKTMDAKIMRKTTFDGTPLFNGYTPTVASDASNVCLGFQDDQTVWFTGSVDGGQSWPQDAIGYQIEELPEKPDVDACGDGRFLGGMVPNYMDNEGSALYKWEISDITDFSAEGYSLLYWTWGDVGDGYTDFIDVAVGAYTATDPAENEWAYGVHTMQGDLGGDGPQPFMSYQFNSDGWAWIYSFGGELIGGESTSVDIDPATLYMYGVWNYFDQETQQNEILIEIMDFGTWDDYEGYPIHPEIGGYTLSTSGSDDAVDISAQNNNVIIVSERDGQIVAYVSFDGFQTDITEVVIAAEGESPRVVHSGDNKATCVFVKNGELYFVTTDNGGTTWSTPVKQSGTEEVVIGDVASLGMAYEAEGVVYYAAGGGDIPIIGIGDIKGGFGVTVEITNTGTGDATDVPYTITATGGLLGMINKQTEGTVSIPAGSSQTVSLPMIIGIGKVTVEVTAASASETVQGTQILIFTLL